MRTELDVGVSREPLDPASLKRLVEVDPAWRESFDRLTTLAGRLLGVPLAQVNVILPGEQHSLSSVTNGDPRWVEYDGPRSVPVESSFCRHVADGGTSLVIDDATQHPLVRENPSTVKGGIRAYIGIPVRNAAGEALATLCVVDFTSRQWSRQELDALSELATFVTMEVRRRASAELAQEEGEARFRALIEHQVDLILILDSEGRITYQSPSVERILGYPREELEGQLFLSLFHPRDRTRLTEGFLALQEASLATITNEGRLKHRDGSWKTVTGTGVNLLHESAVRGIVVNLHDATRERKIEEEFRQAQKMEALGRFVGGIAHDFNNMLTAIKGNASFVLERTDLPRGVQEDVTEISLTADQATDLTRQLLSFSREEPLELKVLELTTVLAEVNRLVERLVGADVRITTEFQSGLRVRADRSRLTQVIMNLAVNARDAMPGGGTLRIRTRSVDIEGGHIASHGEIPAGEYVVLSVRDSGTGMSEEVQERLFDPFFTTKPAGKGTGLGLSTCWGIVRQMGGFIHVYSEEGEGTAIRVYLPRLRGHRAADAVGAGSLTVDREPAEPASPCRILVVEDKPAVRRVIERILARQNHKVVSAESAEEGLERAAEMDQEIDLLLSDVVLPGMNGFALATRLREEQPALRVLFMSGFTPDDFEGDRALLRDASFITKPFEPLELLAAVARELRSAPRPPLSPPLPPVTRRAPSGSAPPPP